MNRAIAEQLATDPEAVAEHSFFPFILATVTTRKIRKKPGGGVELKPAKERPIAYADHKSSHIFTHNSAILHNLYEDAVIEHGLDRVVTAFRSINRWCNIHFANEVFEYIKSMGACFVLASDVSNFFDNLDHKILKRAWGKLLGVPALPPDHYAVYKNITRYCLVDRDELYRVLGIDPLHRDGDLRLHRLCASKEFRDLVRGGGLCKPNKTGKGIPQGSPISAVLANLYMLEFDKVVHDFVTGHGGLYRRFCDDLLIVLPTGESREQALTLVREKLAGLKLEAHPDKTEQVDFVIQGDRLTTPKPLNYLGFTFDGKNKRIRPASIARYYMKMRRGVGRARVNRYRAYTKDGKWSPLRTRKLRLLYSYLGRHNFTTYAFRAARIMGDSGIKKQIKAHWKKLQTLIGAP